MANAVSTNRIGAFDRARLEWLADGCAVGVAVALPWSITASVIFIYVWLALCLLTLDLTSLRRGVAIQLGIVGGAILIAMWIAHLALFRGPGLVSWIGLVIVTQNIVSSLFNSHLFDFFHGWLYVFGVGVVGGMALREKSNATGSSP